MIKHIKSLPHHPARVIVISLVIAALVGTFGYIEINKKPANTVIGGDADTSVTAANTTSANLTLGFLTGGRIASVSVKAGDTVKKGQVLATLDAGNTLGALTEAKAAYTTAEANYQKIINGATGTAVDVAKAAVHTAQVNLDGVTAQQGTLVANANANLLNSTLAATIVGADTSSLTPPTITGTYTKGIEGTLTISVNLGGSNQGSFLFSGVANGTGQVSATLPQAIGDTGLYIEFPSIDAYAGTTWDIKIPNDKAANYLSNYNAYQSALQVQSQSIANAQASLDQANASLTALVTAARPEDVAAAQAQVDNAGGAVQIAEAAYENTIITAPTDGTVVSVAIAPGQIAAPNAPAIEFTSLTSSQ
jgi:HlyD family secretion protein